LQRRFPALFAAHSIHSERGELRDELEAWLLTQASPVEIGARLGVPADAVEMFEQVFFNVRVVGRARATDWVWCTVFLDPGHDYWNPPDAVILKFMAMTGGSVVLDALQAEKRGEALPGQSFYARAQWATRAALTPECDTAAWHDLVIKASLAGGSTEERRQFKLTRRLAMTLGNPRKRRRAATRAASPRHEVAAPAGATWPASGPSLSAQGAGGRCREPRQASKAPSMVPPGSLGGDPEALDGGIRRAGPLHDQTPAAQHRRLDQLPPAPLLHTAGVPRPPHDPG
jgi:hypothetical protein